MHMRICLLPPHIPILPMYLSSYISSHSESPLTSSGTYTYIVWDDDDDNNTYTVYLNKLRFK